MINEIGISSRIKLCSRIRMQWQACISKSTSTISPDQHQFKYAKHRIYLKIPLRDTSLSITNCLSQLRNRLHYPTRQTCKLLSLQKHCNTYVENLETLNWANVFHSADNLNTRADNTNTRADNTNTHADNTNTRADNTNTRQADADDGDMKVQLQCCCRCHWRWWQYGDHYN